MNTSKHYKHTILVQVLHVFERKERLYLGQFEIFNLNIQIDPHSNMLLLIIFNLAGCASVTSMIQSHSVRIDIVRLLNLSDLNRSFTGVQVNITSNLGIPT